MRFIYEDIDLDEAHFTGNIDHFQSHYDQHVLGEKEKFDTQDPRFPCMTEEEYYDAAEELSTHKAGNINSDYLYVGSKLDFKDRLIKIRRQSKYVKGNYMDVVIYTDEPNDQIYSFMLVKQSRLEKYKQQIIDDLPENK